MLENKGTYPKEGEQAPLSLYVDDFSAPILNNLSVVPKTSNINTTLKFKVNTSDGEGSGIKNVTVQYSIDEMKTWQEVELVSNGSESKIYNNSIPGFQNNTIFIFYAILEDNEGNIYNSSLEGYEYGFVADSDKLNPPPPKETGKNIGIGIGIGAVALLGLEGLIKFVIERRKKK